MSTETKLDRMREAASKTYDAAMLMPRPECYKQQSQGEWKDGVKQMVEDLCRLAFDDGCIAAAWAMSMIQAAGRRPVTAAHIVSWAVECDERGAEEMHSANRNKMAAEIINRYFGLPTSKESTP